MKNQIDLTLKLSIEFKPRPIENTTCDLQDLQTLNEIKTGQILELDATAVLENEKYEFISLWLSPDFSNLAHELISANNLFPFELAKLIEQQMRGTK